MAKTRAHSAAKFFSSRLTATVSIALVLFVSGLIILLSIVAKNISTHVRESLSIDVVLADDVKESQVEQTIARLRAAPFAATVRFISKEEAAKEVEKEIGQNPEEFLGFNPLPAIIAVNLKEQYAQTDSLPVIEKYIRSYSADVRDIQYRQDLLQMANRNLAQIGFIFLVLALILMLISFALINNTVRLLIYSKRFLIHTMKLVGATNAFIRRPFVRSFALSGVLSAFIANALITWLLIYFAGDIRSISGLLNINSLIFVYICVFTLGIIISTIAALWAVNRFLSMKEDDLYFA